jgi:glyoxylase-like metal-dependent hydrolase (beta-lactamase superfamily II)
VQEAEVATTPGTPGTSGPYEVLAVRYGTRSTVASQVYLNWFQYNEPDHPVEMDYFFWLVRGAGRVILVDTGFTHEVGARRGRTTTTAPLQALRRLGVATSQVDTVVVTHGHYDHTGHVSQFPDADVVMAGRELDFWSGPYSTRAQFAHSAERADLEGLVERDREGRLQRVAGRAELTPGVAVREVGGHTPGQLIVEVEAQQGPVVLASDAVHYYEELERDRPFVVVADLEAMYAGFDTVAELASAPGAVLVPGHDPLVMQKFAPVDPDVPDLAVRVG